MWTLFTGNKEGSKGLMVPRVKPIPTRFPANSLYTPMDNTPLHSISTLPLLWLSEVIEALKSELVRTVQLGPRSACMQAHTAEQLDITLID